MDFEFVSWLEDSWFKIFFLCIRMIIKLKHNIYVIHGHFIMQVVIKQVLDSIFVVNYLLKEQC